MEEPSEEGGSGRSEKEGFFAVVISFLVGGEGGKKEEVEGSSFNDNWFARDSGEGRDGGREGR